MNTSRPSAMRRRLQLRLPGWVRHAWALPEALAARVRRSVLALPLVAAAVLAMVLINEMGHDRSVQALARLEQRGQATAHIEALQRRLLDAQTAHRGYLLSGRRIYLAPYEHAAGDIAEAQRWLREHHRGDPLASGLLDTLQARTGSALADMARNVQSFDAAARRLPWQGALDRAPLDAVRDVSAQLMQRERQAIARERQAVFTTLRNSRIGVSAAAALGILALLAVLRQTAALDAAQRRHARALHDDAERLAIEVQRRTDDLTELAKHLQSVREDERSRLARDLHEDLGALLTTAKLDVARLRGRLAAAAPEVHARLAHLGASLDAGIALKRRIIEDLHPLALSNLGLAAALQLQLRQFAERTGLPVHSELQSLPLADSVQITVYRLVQEALTNIAKYARAGSVTVRLRAHGNAARLSVEDDGQGFDPAVPRHSTHGLMGMRYRVEAVAGRFDIHSAPGQGTRIDAELPLRVEAEAPLRVEVEAPLRVEVETPLRVELETPLRGGAEAR